VKLPVFAGAPFPRYSGTQIRQRFRCGDVASDRTVFPSESAQTSSSPQEYTVSSPQAASFVQPFSLRNAHPDMPVAKQSRIAILLIRGMSALDVMTSASPRRIVTAITGLVVLLV